MELFLNSWAKQDKEEKSKQGVEYYLQIEQVKKNHEAKTSPHKNWGGI